MRNQWRTWLGVAALGGSALAGATVAAAAGSSSKTSTTTTATTTTSTGHARETPLSGDVAAKAKTAAVAKVGGTAGRASTETDSSNPAAAYEVHVTKADGTHAEVILDKNYNVLVVETGHGFGRGDHGRGGNGETELTGDVAAKAKAAAVAKVGGTAERASTETDSSNAAAAYEVHVTKTDGTHVEVILDKNYNVLAVETHEGHGPHR